MNIPFHSAIVHFPMALTFVMPVIVLFVGWLLRSNKASPSSWFVVIGLFAVITLTGYLALQTGQNDEDFVGEVVKKVFIQEHEAAAQIFVGSVVICFVLSIVAFFIRKEIQFPLHLVIAALAVVSSYLGYRAGSLGGELVYVHGAASAYVKGPIKEHIIDEDISRETPFRPVETDDNESLKTDENDYSGTDASLESDEDSKQED